MFSGDIENFIAKKFIKQKQPFADALQNSALKTFAIFTGKYLCWSLFFRPGLQFIKKGNPTQVFSCKYGEIVKNSSYLTINQKNFASLKINLKLYDDEFSFVYHSSAFQKKKKKKKKLNIV